MKCIFATGIAVALAGAANAQFTRPDAGIVRSVSDQFVVHGATQTSPSMIVRALATNVNYIELSPARLAITSERIKQAVYRELGEASPWRGRIHLYLQPVRALDEPVTIVSDRFRDGWKYRLSLPQFVERERFIRAIVQTLLMELANRKAGDRAPEIPVWLTEGLTQRLLAMPDVELTPSETRWTADGRAIGPTVFDIRRVDSRKQETPPAMLTANSMRVIWVDPLEEARRHLLARPPLTIEELSWPDGKALDGETGDAYRHSAQLFVTELLRLKDGRESARAMLDELAGCYNWQTAFFRAFHAHFAQQLDLEKWWSLQVVNLTGRDSRLLTLEESWRELDRIVRTPVEVRHATNELPERSEVTLQFIVREWDQIQQTPALQARLRDLEVIRHRAPPDLAGLITDYYNVLSSYLRQRDKVGLILTSTTRDPNIRLKTLVRDAVKQLDVLDARRMALRPETDSPPVTLGTTVSPKP
jgi:hypothetical protein